MIAYRVLKSFIKLVTSPSYITVNDVRCKHKQIMRIECNKVLCVYDSISYLDPCRTQPLFCQRVIVDFQKKLD